MESDYSDDDDYLPITAGVWGDQAKQQNQDGNEGVESTNCDPTKTDINGWSGLIDPEAKKKAGALGSGGLHRQGKNYKPISEEHIIKQRKGVVIPKSKDTKKTRAPRSGSNQTTPTPSTPHRSFSRPTKAKPSTTTTNFSKQKYQQATVAHPAPPPPSSTIRRPPPPSSSGQSGWGAQPLVETPFWEKKDNTMPSAQSRRGSSQQQNGTNQWGSRGNQPVNGATERPSAPGYNDHSPTTTTLSPPPGFGPVPQRQYPVKSNSKSQPQPPPGFSYSEKPAWGTPSTKSSNRNNSSNNNNNAQLHSWTTNDEAKELWRRMEEATQATNQATNNYESNAANDNNTNDNNTNNSNKNNSNLDWVSGWDDLSLNNKKATPPPPPPPPPSSASQGSNGRAAATTFSTTNTGGWGSAPTTNDTGGWGSAPTTNDTGGWGTTASPTNNNKNNSNSSNGQWETPTATDSTHLEQGDDTTTSPMQFLDQQMAGYSRGRFSDPSKNKYSSATAAMDHDTGSKHLPKNYYTRNGTSRPAFMDAPHRIAQPPPSHNPVVIEIHLELENGTKLPIPIRKLDNPQALAQTFCQSQNITNPATINVISDLFAQQKSTATKRYNRP